MRVPKPLAYALFVLPWAAALFGLAWLLIMRYPPSGVFQVTSPLDGKSSWINPFLPAERTTTPGKQPDGWIGQRVIDDPVYLSALVPGPYENVDVDIEYRPVNQPLMEFGMVHDAAGQQLELKPLYSSELQSEVWQQAEAQGYTGYVRQGRAAARLMNPDPQGLAVWDATGTFPEMRDASAPEKSYPVSLRGSHDFYLVPTDRLAVTFMLQPANRIQTTDMVAFQVFCGDNQIQQEAFDISGSRETRMGKPTEHAIEIPQAADCIYHIALTASDDVFIREIRTVSRHWVIGPRLVVGDVVGYATSTYPAQVWTNSRHIVAETFHTQGLQTVTFGQSSKKISRTHTLVRLDRSDEQRLAELTAPSGDVRFIGDGFFALSPDAFFEPKPPRFTDATNLDAERIDAVLTDYVKPDTLADSWLRSHFSFKLDPTLDRLRFVLSSPGVVARSAAVDVRRITLTYHRPAISFKDWWSTLRQELANAWHRL